MRRESSRPDRKSTRLNSSHSQISYFPFFFFNDTAPTEISPLSLHDALPISSMLTGQRTMAATYFEKDMDEERVEPTRSEEHTSELQSQSNLLFPLFFF